MKDCRTATLTSIDSSFQTIAGHGEELCSIFKFNEAILFQVHCETQKGVDYYWEKLSDGGDERAQQSGWLKDKQGMSWQIVPKVLRKLLGHPVSDNSERAMKTLLQMKKIDIQKIKRAYDDHNIAERNI